MGYVVYRGSDVMTLGEPYIIQKAQVNLLCPVHVHDFIEIVYILSGEGVHTVNHQSFHVTGGELFVMNTNVPHEFTSYENSPLKLEVYNCIFQPDFIDYSFLDTPDFIEASNHFFFNSVSPERTNEGFVKIVGNKAWAFDNLFHDMYCEYTLRADGYERMLRAYLTILLIKVFRAYRMDHQLDRSLSGMKRQIVENTVTYVQQHYDENIRLEELAALSFLSPSYFSKVFKEYTDQTLTQFIQNQRIQAACQQLRSTDIPIDSIAEDVGYKDIKSFYAVFRKLMGVTPGQYRKDNRPAI